MKDKVNKVIGLEIFDNELRAAEVTLSDGKLKILAANTVQMPDGVFDNGVLAKPEVFTSCFRSLVTGHFNTKNIVIEFANQDTIMRIANFPKVDDDRQENVIRLQAQEFIPVPLTELELGYSILGPSEDDTEVSALLVAIKQSIITAVIDLLQSPKAGSYTVVDVTIGTTAIVSVLADYITANPFMFVHTNSDALNILILKNKRIVVARSVRFDDSVSEALNHTNYDNVIGDLLDAAVGQIENEIRASINYFNIKNDDEIGGVYIYSQFFDASRRFPDISANIGGIDVHEAMPDNSVIAFKGCPAERYFGCAAIAAVKLG